MREVEQPVPTDDEVLIKVRAASLNPLDEGFMNGGARVITGLRRPKVTRLGVDVAGEIEAVGKRVTQFRPGDAVFGVCLKHPEKRGVGAWVCQGAFAEYACVPESALALKPDTVTFEQAASVPVAAFTALQGLRDKGHIQPGQAVLVNGAAGGVGTFAVQIAKALGAVVTGVCSTRNVDLVRSIRADQAIDYLREDFTKRGERYDLIFDCVGNHALSAYRRVLSPGGVCVMVGDRTGRGQFGILTRAITALVWSRFTRKKFVIFLARPNQADLTIMRDFMAIGKVTPVIDRHYRLSEVADAIRYMQGRHARGKVVIRIGI